MTQMNSQNKNSSIFMKVVSIAMIVAAIGLGVGTKFFDLSIGAGESWNDISFWILIGISTLLTFTMFFSAKNISNTTELDTNQPYLDKHKSIKEANIITGLEHSDEFLDEHYIDKKVDKFTKKMRNKLARVRRKSDRKGYNFFEPEKHVFKPLKWYRWFNGKWRFNRLLKKRNKFLDKVESPTLRNDLKYKHIRGVFRVTRAYLSDGINKYSDRRDPDRPVSGMAVSTSKGVQKLAISLIIVLFGANIGYELLADGFDSSFWVDLAMKLVSYLTTIVNGYLFGKVFFQDVHMDLAIKRENLLQKYIQWVKSKYPESWQKMLSNRKALQTQEIEIAQQIKHDEAKAAARALKIEEGMKANGIM